MAQKGKTTFWDLLIEIVRLEKETPAGRANLKSVALLVGLTGLIAIPATADIISGTILSLKDKKPLGIIPPSVTNGLIIITAISIISCCCFLLYAERKNRIK